MTHDSLVTAALVGTSRTGLPHLTTDPSFPALPDVPPERKLLLLAGAQAAYQMAGVVPPPSPDPPPPAPPDTLNAGSGRLHDILRSILTGDPDAAVDQLLYGGQAMQSTGLRGRHYDLLPEALTLLQSQRLRLPVSLLPQVLNAKPGWLRELLLPVLGERGRWLAGFNPAWAWATVPDVAVMLPAARAGRTSVSASGEEAGRVSDTLVVLWRDGPPERRLAALKLHRQIDPAGARERLQPVFRSCRYDIRVRMVEALATGLSLDDEPFLEDALNDRDNLVRRRAALQLARLPDSACARRVVQRADGMLARVPNGPLKGKLLAIPPPQYDGIWKREGIEPNPQQYSGADKRGLWMAQTLHLVPVQHWVDRFGAPVRDLLAALEEDWKGEVLEGWTLAATELGEVDHLPALWDAWWERRHKPVRYKFMVAQMLGALARGMRQADAGERLRRFLADPHMHPEDTLGRVLQETPMPWAEDLGDAYLETLRRISEELRGGKEPPLPWLYTLDHAARGLPHGYIRPALDLIPPSIPDTYDTWRQVLEMTREKLSVRQQLIDEIQRTDR